MLSAGAPCGLCARTVILCAYFMKFGSFGIQRILVVLKSVALSSHLIWEALRDSPPAGTTPLLLAGQSCQSPYVSSPFLSLFLITVHG